MKHKVVLDMSNPKTLTSIAMLETLWEIKHSDMLDLITPFVKYAIVHTTTINDSVDTAKVASFVKAEFGYKEFPESIITKILKRNSPAFFKKEGGQYRYIVSLDVEVEKLDKRRTECKEHIDIIAEVLAVYLSAHCKHKHNFTPKEAANALQSFFEQYGLFVGANPQALEAISPQKYETDYYVAQFIFENQKNGTKEYDYIVDLVKGYFLSTVVYLQPDNANILTASYRNVSFYYDTPFLIQFLGYQSKQAQNSAIELHQLLKRQSGSFFYFPQTEEEIISILTAYQHSLSSRNSSKTLEGLDILEYGTDSVERLKHTFPARLASPQNAISRVPLPPYPQKADGSVDVESGLISDEAVKEHVLKFIGHYKPDSLDADVASATAIDRLRPRVAVQNIETCKAIFVTTNSDFAKAFNAFYEKNVLSNTFPLVITSADLAAIAWVKCAAFDNTIPNQQLLSNAYMAMQPLPQLMERFRAVVSQLQAEGQISSDEAFILRTNKYIIKELNLSTLGNVECVTDGLVSSLQKKYKESLVADANKAHEEQKRREHIEKNKGACEKARNEAKTTREKYYNQGCFISHLVLWMIFIAACWGTIYDLYSDWSLTARSVLCLILLLFSLISIYDTVFARKSKIDLWIQKHANQKETEVYEKKKAEYFSVLGVTKEELGLFPTPE